MKKLTSIILVVLIFLISIMTLNSKAYSTNDFSIDIPSYYQYSGEDSFVSYEGNAVIIETNPFDTSEDFKYTQDNLNRLTSLIKESYQEYYGITSNIIDSQVVKFSDNKYKGFYLRSSVTISGNTFFADQYIVVSGNYVYSLTIMTLNSTNYLNSEEAKSIVNSFTINNFEPIDNSIAFVEVLHVLSVIILCILVIVFVIKIIDNKKHSQKEEINFDEYNVGNSGHIENTVNTNSNELKSSTINDKEQREDKKINTKKEYLLPMRWYNFYGFIRLPIGIAILIINLCMNFNMLFEYNFLTGILILFITIIQLIYMIYLINIMSSKKKNGLNYITGWLCIETLMISSITILDRNDFNVLILLMSICLYTLIWFLPNYTYFKKREYIFETEDK